MLLIGLNDVSETYLRAAVEFASGQIKIVGLLGRNDRHVGRMVASHRILGAPEDVGAVVKQLESHGIAVDRIVIATSYERLSPAARGALIDLERSSSIVMQYLAEDLGFAPKGDPSADARNASPPATNDDVSFEIAPHELDLISRRPYWRTKRILDIAISSACLIALAPVLVAVAIVVGASIGFPLVFWQQRPGLGGRPFRVYKFRTMSAAHAPDGRRLTDAERVSGIGTFLRRTRLDELPQLINILRGDMSIIGPRPLLPIDQHQAYRARLLVRPGLTGWAQVIGGRAISPEDKAALDVWYVYNASFLLDLKIIARTLPMVVFGETTSQHLINLAWNDLSKAGILRQTHLLSFGQRLRSAS